MSLNCAASSGWIDMVGTVGEDAGEVTGSVSGSGSIARASGTGRLVAFASPSFSAMIVGVCG